MLAAGCGVAGSTTAAAPGSTSQPRGAAAGGQGGTVPGRGGFPVLLPVPPGHPDRPQTRTRPGSRTGVFRAEMTDLWAAVVTGRPALGMPSFFPLAAYRQVKAIADPAADWRDRLVAEFRLDTGAAHRLLGRAARSARLVRVIVPASQASWVSPGTCYNDVGYWHVAGARIVYRVRHQLRSIGIASLISWRGRWYVVHFGAVLRAGPGGMVDQPAAGPGTPGPAGGC
jgi:hypothetical protein